jgi:hypothetical protein
MIQPSLLCEPFTFAVYHAPRALTLYPQLTFVHAVVTGKLENEHHAA